MFKKLIYNWRLSRILNDSLLTDREKCLQLLMLIPDNSFKELTYRSLTSITITTLNSSIDSYTSELKTISNQINSNAAISSNMLQSKEKVISLEMFFIDKEGCYMDINNSFNNFKKESIRFLNALSKSDTVDYGYYEYVGRVVKHILLNILKISRQLSVLIGK